MKTIGKKIYHLAERLWPINRSITGDGVRDSLKIIQEYIPDLKIFEVPTGTSAFDWRVPKEWKIRDAYIITPDGQKICDFKKNNLHVVGYSCKVEKELSLDQLQPYLYSIPEQPNAIPYVTSYYEERWGFCIAHEDREKLRQGKYKVFIDSEIFDGSLTYGELKIKGSTPKEIFISTYVCHPSMANNEISGPSVATFLALWVLSLNKRKYSYRFVFIPETIGSITYLSKNLEYMKKYVHAGFNISCVGDDRAYSYVPTRKGDSISDKVAMHVLSNIDKNYKKYSWTQRGSDERQYCAPGVDLSVASIMRTKYGEYEEYHTSLDDLVNVVSSSGLYGGYEANRLAIEAIEKNVYPLIKVLCEPNLGSRGLYPTIHTRGLSSDSALLKNFISCCDGEKSLLEISEICKVPVWTLYNLCDKLQKQDLISIHERPKPVNFLSLI